MNVYSTILARAEIAKASQVSATRRAESVTAYLRGLRLIGLVIPEPVEMLVFDQI